MLLIAGLINILTGFSIDFRSLVSDREQRFDIQLSDESTGDDNSQWKYGEGVAGVGSQNMRKIDEATRTRRQHKSTRPQQRRQSMLIGEFRRYHKALVPLAATVHTDVPDTYGRRLGIIGNTLICLLTWKRKRHYREFFVNVPFFNFRQPTRLVTLYQAAEIRE